LVQFAYRSHSLWLFCDRGRLMMLKGRQPQLLPQKNQA